MVVNKKIFDKPKITKEISPYDLIGGTLVEWNGSSDFTITKDGKKYNIEVILYGNYDDESYTETKVTEVS